MLLQIKRASILIGKLTNKLAIIEDVLLWPVNWLVDLATSLKIVDSAMDRNSCIVIVDSFKNTAVEH
jgi:hypothetical protein